jgi:hypothetical protein
MFIKIWIFYLIRTFILSSLSVSYLFFIFLWNTICKRVLKCLRAEICTPAPPPLRTDVTDILVIIRHRRDRHVQNGLLQTWQTFQKQGVTDVTDILATNYHRCYTGFVEDSSQTRQTAYQCLFSITDMTDRVKGQKNTSRPPPPSGVKKHDLNTLLETNITPVIYPV